MMKYKYNSRSIVTKG